MTAIVDYGCGNLFSLQSSLKYIGSECAVSGDAEFLKKADRLILPGVGAFKDAASLLKKSGLDEVVTQQAKEGKPLLGICLGMQLLFEKSYEYGETDGLALISGSIQSIENVIPNVYKIPHIGWNGLNFTENGKKSPLFKYVREGDCVYFVHSYAAFGCEGSLLATAEYGAPLTAAVSSGNVFGTQFHPEKSGEVGLKILKAFCEM